MIIRFVFQSNMCIYIMKMFIKISKMKSIHYIVYQRVVFAQDFAVLYTECVTYGASESVLTMVNT